MCRDWILKNFYSSIGMVQISLSTLIYIMKDFMIENWNMAIWKESEGNSFYLNLFD